MTNQCEITEFGIHLKVADIMKSRAFYESLGFQPVFAYGDDEFRATLPAGLQSAPERYRGITYKIGDSAHLEIADGHVAVPAREVYQEKISSPKISAMVRVKSLLPLFNNPLVNIKVPVRHYYWGTIEAVFRDPDGFVLVLIAPFTQQELQELSRITTIQVIEAGKELP